MAAGPSHLGLTLAQRYQLTDLLAQGALCDVYRAYDLVLRRAMVVKAVRPPHTLAVWNALERTAALTHPAIIPSYDAYALDDWIFLAQQHVAARPLATYLRNGLPVERSVALGIQIARALAYAHGRGVIHGDVTPAAVLIDRRANVYLNNAGFPPDTAYLATFEGLHEPPSGVQHPPRPDNAPSDTTDTFALDASEDTRALGLLLWQMLSTPIVTSPAGADAPTLDAQSAARAFRPEAPAELCAIIRRSIARHDPERITSMETLALLLTAQERDLMRERPLIAEVTPPALRAMRVSTARRAPWSAQETAGNLATWAPDDVTIRNEERDPLDFPTSPLSLASNDRAFAGPPRLKLPSRPFDQDPYASAARYDGDAPTIRAGASSPGMSVSVIIALGLALFALFFILGLLLPPILGH